MPPDAGLPDTGGTNEPLQVPGGDVMGMWSGEVRVAGTITVQAGQTLEIMGGSRVVFEAGAFNIAGTLRLTGSADSRIEIIAASQWAGLKVANGGVLEGGGLEISGAAVCLTGNGGSSINLDNSLFSNCGSAMSLVNGGVFRYITVIGGQTISITGGVLDIADSTIDFRGGAFAPDCTDWAGGSAIIDHVRFTSCHCPLHFNRTDAPVMVTNSIFDQGANSVMIANTQATFRNNVFETDQTEMLGIGPGINADIGGNYWGGGEPNYYPRDNQYTNTADYLTTRPTDVGPR
jgi:hypothetical protein